MINNITKTNSAKSYHSKTQEKDVLSQLKDENSETKIIIGVDKLNESIDLPVVENIVFWRGTDNSRIFLQQFGRGLRGNNTVNYYDYAGSMKNFTWVGNIYTEYKEKLEEKKSKNLEENNSNNEENFSLTGGNLFTQNFEVNLYDLGFKINSLKEKVKLTQEDVKEYFLKKDIKDLLNLTTREKTDIKIKGKGLCSISSLFGVEGDPANNKEIWREFLGKVLETKIEIDDLTKEDVKEYFLEKDLDYWLKFTKKEKTKIKIKGKGLRSISRLFGVEGYPVNNKEIWIEFLEKVFETKIESDELTQEDVKEYFLEKDLDYWLKFTQKEKTKIKIKGKGIYTISSLFGVEGNPVINNIWIEFLNKIFEDEKNIQ